MMDDRLRNALVFCGILSALIAYSYFIAETLTNSKGSDDWISVAMVLALLFGGAVVAAYAGEDIGGREK